MRDTTTMHLPQRRERAGRVGLFAPAAPGVRFATSCATSASPGEVASRVAEATAGLASVSVATNASGDVVATRTYRPRWSRVLAAATVVFAFLGLLFLLVKRTEVLTVTIVPYGSGAIATASGSSDAQFIGRLTKALVTLPDVTDPDGGVFTPPILASASTEIAGTQASS